MLIIAIVDFLQLYILYIAGREGKTDMLVTIIINKYEYSSKASDFTPNEP